MSRKSLLKQAESEILNSFQAKQYQTEVGSKAKVESFAVPNEVTDVFKDLLRELGAACQEVDPSTKHMEYCGSVAVHIYMAPMTRTMAFHVQNALGGTNELVAGSAISVLRKRIMEYFGRKPGKLRSGL